MPCRSARHFLGDSDFSLIIYNRIQSGIIYVNIAEESDMEMMEFLEADREQLMSGLKAAGTPELAQRVLEKEFD